MEAGKYTPAISVFLCYPTGPFTIWEHQNRDIGEFHVVQEGRATDFFKLQSPESVDRDV